MIIKQLFVPCWGKYVVVADYPWNAWVQKLTDVQIDDPDLTFDYIDIVGRETRYYVSRMATFETGGFMAALEHCLACEDCMIFNIRVQGVEYSDFEETFIFLVETWNKMTGANVNWCEEFVKLIEEKMERRSKSRRETPKEGS